MSDPLLPDAEVLLVGFLAAHPDVAPLVSGARGPRVGTSLDQARPAIRITRLGRPPTQTWEDNPELQVECWAPSQDAASILVRTVVASFGDLGGPYAEGYVGGWEITLGPM